MIPEKVAVILEEALGLSLGNGKWVTGVAEPLVYLSAAARALPAADRQKLVATARQAFSQAVKLAQKARGSSLLPGGPLMGGKTFTEALSQAANYFHGVGYDLPTAKKLAYQALGAAGWQLPTPSAMIAASPMNIVLKFVAV